MIVILSVCDFDELTFANQRMIDLTAARKDNVLDYVWLWDFGRTA